MAATSTLLCLIQNPPAHLWPDEQLEVVRYIVREESWQRYAQRVVARTIWRLEITRI